MDINDQRAINGQIYIDLGPEDGNVDDIMSVCMEVNKLPDTNTATQCLHLFLDGEKQSSSMKILKRGDAYILHPDRELNLNADRLPNGELVYVLS